MYAIMNIKHSTAIAGRYSIMLIMLMILLVFIYGYSSMFVFFQWYVVLDFWRSSIIRNLEFCR